MLAQVIRCLWVVSQFKKSASFTRPADTTAYAANDAIADSTSAPTLLSFANCAKMQTGVRVTLLKTRLLTNQKRVRHVLDYRFIHSTKPC